MNKRQTIVVGLLVIALITGLWLLVPPGASIKSQLLNFWHTIIGIATWILMKLIWVVKWILLIVAWLIEVIILLLGPFVLGWAFRLGLKRLDDRLTPGQNMTSLQGFFLNAGLTVVMFLLWILVPLAATLLPPISMFAIGPWIRGHMETGLVWWGVYGGLVYLIFPGLQYVANNA